ncbi:bacteriohemerythrin, partial [candidate division KSB1 bacterium]
VDLINELQKAMEKKKGGDVLDSIMKELSDYTFYHFSFEESYMEKIGFPELESHKECHSELSKKVYEIFNKIYDYQIISKTEIYDFLKSWLIDHILEKDREYKKFAESGSK